MAEDTSRFREREGLIREAERIDNGFREAGEGCRGGGENFLCDGVSPGGSFVYDGEKFRKDGVRMLREALEERIPVAGFRRVENFAAERGRRAEMVAVTESRCDGAAADIVCAAWVANPRAPAPGTDGFSRGVAAAGSRASSSDDDDSLAMRLNRADGGFESDFDVRGDANGGLRKCTSEIGAEPTSNARASGARDARTDGADVFGLLASFGKGAARGFFQRGAGFSESGAQRIGRAAGSFGKEATRGVESDAICFRAASVKAQKDRHVFWDSLWRKLRLLRCEK